MRSTHTYALMDVSASTYEEIKRLLTDAGYHHAIHTEDGKEVLDMHGLALQPALASHPMEFDFPVHYHRVVTGEMTDVAWLTADGRSITVRPSLHEIGSDTADGVANALRDMILGVRAMTRNMALEKDGPLSIVVLYRGNTPNHINDRQRGETTLSAYSGWYGVVGFYGTWIDPAAKGPSLATG